MSLDISGVSLNVLSGPTSPESGIYLGYDLEQAVTESITMAMRHVQPKFLKGGGSSWLDDRGRVRQQGYVDTMHSSLNTGVSLSGKPENEAVTWRSYLMTKAIFAENFRPYHHEGFDGDLDQLVNWTSPVDDNEYDKCLGYAKEWLEAAEGVSCDKLGVALAKQAFVLDTLSSAESEIVTGRDTRRDGRIKTIAKLLSEVREIEPRLVGQALDAHQLLRQAILRRMDPWGYRFKHP